MKKPKKEIEAAQGLIDFFDQLGEENSIYKKVVLEVFLEELLNGKNLHLFGEAGQEGNQGNSNAERKDKSKPS